MTMDFELRVIPGCPNTGTARALFEQALALEALDAATVPLREITTDDQAGTLPRLANVRGKRP